MNIHVVALLNSRQLWPKFSPLFLFICQATVAHFPSFPSQSFACSNTTASRHAMANLPFIPDLYHGVFLDLWEYSLCSISFLDTAFIAYNTAWSVAGSRHSYFLFFFYSLLNIEYLSSIIPTLHINTPMSGFVKKPGNCVPCPHFSMFLVHVLLETTIGTGPHFLLSDPCVLSFNCPITSQACHATTVFLTFIFSHSCLLFLLP